MIKAYKGLYKFYHICFISVFLFLLSFILLTMIYFHGLECPCHLLYIFHKVNYYYQITLKLSKDFLYNTLNMANEEKCIP